MSSDIKFIDGLSFKEPHEKAPDFVKARGAIKVADLLAWLQSQSGEWVNFDVKESQAGKWYAAVDGWKPSGNISDSGSRGGATQLERPARTTEQPKDDFVDDDIPW